MVGRCSGSRLLRERAISIYFFAARLSNFVTLFHSVHLSSSLAFSVSLCLLLSITMPQWYMHTTIKGRESMRAGCTYACIFFFRVTGQRDRRQSTRMSFLLSARQRCHVSKYLALQWTVGSASYLCTRTHRHLHTHSSHSILPRCSTSFSFSDF